MKIGDRVRIVCAWEPKGPMPGQRGTVTEIDEDGDIFVRLDGAPDNVYPLSFRPSDLEIIQGTGKEEDVLETTDIPRYCEHCGSEEHYTSEHY